MYADSRRTGYVGCFDDSSNARLLDVYKGNGVGHVQLCAVKCSGYKYFGMEVKQKMIYSVAHLGFLFFLGEGGVNFFHRKSGEIALRNHRFARMVWGYAFQ